MKDRKYGRAGHLVKYEQKYSRPQYSRGPPTDRKDAYLVQEPEVRLQKDYCFNNNVSEYMARGWTLDEAARSFLPAEEIKVLISLLDRFKVHSAYFDPEEAQKVMERKFAKEYQYGLAYISIGSSQKLYSGFLRNSVTGELFTAEEHAAIKRCLARNVN